MSIFNDAYILNMENSLIEFETITANLNSNIRIFAKDESKNPSGSIKDKAVVCMLNSFKKEGKLKPGCKIIEATSGNTGISLAYFAKEFDYTAVIVMPKTASENRKKMIASLGAELILVEGGMKECKEKVKEILAASNDIIELDQFNNLNNALAHTISTGPEILKECPNVTHIFAGFGTGGTISGVSSFVKHNRPNCKIIGVEPEESPLVSKGHAGSHIIEGIGANFIPKTLDLRHVDGIIAVKGEESKKMAIRIRKEEGLDIGVSSGAALLGALEFIRMTNLKSGNIVVIFPDKGDRYSW